jgi:hypothetical protein
MSIEGVEVSALSKLSRVILPDPMEREGRRAVGDLSLLKTTCPFNVGNSSNRSIKPVQQVFGCAREIA